mmetsp:Transcript_119913/g.344558  ORF Transcript_119913/g.344558 Transcript_119913/m.344558 type:complete len:84 (+) Transcript_119913:911-1162(+)
MDMRASRPTGEGARPPAAEVLLALPAVPPCGRQSPTLLPTEPLLPGREPGADTVPVAMPPAAPRTDRRVAPVAGEAPDADEPP